jgi:phosphate transport system substrate-binding protein
MVALLGFGCNGKPRKPKPDPQDSTQTRKPYTGRETTTQGVINLGIDETMYGVMHQIVDAFLRDHKEATINEFVGTEGDLVDQLLADSLRMVIMGRELTPAEMAFVKKDKIYPTATMIARDAVAVILHPEAPMDSIKMSDLRRILRGEAKTWRDIGGDSDEAISLIFDSPRSGSLRLLQDRLMEPGQQLPANAYLAKGQDSVVSAVALRKSAIGFVGYCMISDRDAAKTKDILSQVQLARLDATDTSDVPGYFVRPYQNEISLGRYPLSRPMYAVSREHFVGLGTGFVVYAASDLGQRILLKAGLVPAFMPPRVVVLPENED